MVFVSGYFLWCFFLPPHCETPKNVRKKSQKNNGFRLFGRFVLQKVFILLSQSFLPRWLGIVERTAFFFEKPVNARLGGTAVCLLYICLFAY
jgi:hypothetical protein